MMTNNLLATFSLETSQANMEIAIEALRVIEAVPCPESLTEVPGSVDFLAGVMNLREKIIPVINLKKRFRLSEDSYNTDARVVIVTGSHKLYGLLVDSIQSVQSVEPQNIYTIPPEARTDDQIIKSVIKTDAPGRILEYVCLDFLFSSDAFAEINQLADTSDVSIPDGSSCENNPRNQYIIVNIGGAHFGIPTSQLQEIIPPQPVDKTFASGISLGSIEFRDRTIPLISPSIINQTEPQGESTVPAGDILIIRLQEKMFALPVSQTVEILFIEDSKIMSVPYSVGKGYNGVYSKNEHNDILLIDMEGVNLSIDNIVYKKSHDTLPHTQQEKTAATAHLISDKSVLVFTVKDKFAVQVKSVQEIINYQQLIPVTGKRPEWDGLLNLRGAILPVISLRKFLGYGNSSNQEEQKIVIVTDQKQTVGLVADDITTILKEPDTFPTISLNDQFAERGDILDKFINYTAPDGLVEKLLMINIETLIANCL